MVSQRIFVGLFDCNPFTFPKLKKCNKTPKWIRAILILNEIVAFASILKVLYKTKLTDISSFVLITDFTIDVLSILMNTYALIVYNDSHHVFIEDLTDFDTCLNVQYTYATFDQFLFSITIVSVFQMFAMIWFIPYYVIWYTGNLAVNMFAIYQVSAMIYFISNRAQLLVRSIAESEDSLELTGLVRRILHYNKQVNNAYSQRLANALFTSTAVLLHSMTAFWRVFGLHKIDDSFEYLAPVLTFAVHWRLVFEMGFLVFSTSRFASCVSILNL